MENKLKVVLSVLVLVLALLSYFLIFNKDMTYELKLDANASTGYTWSYDMNEDGIVKVVKDEYEEGKSEEGMTGVPGTQVYKFKALKKGEVTIKFTYSRPNSSEIADIKSYKLTVGDNYKITAKELVTIKDDTKANIYTIELDSNPTTGYTWIYEVDNENIVENVKDEYIQNDVSDDTVGAGGKQHFEFIGVNEGEVKLTFKYKRSWEDEVADQKVYNLNVDKKLKITLK